MRPFYPALLTLLPFALSAPDKPRRSAEARLDAVESLARHALARLDDLEDRVNKMEQPTTAMKDEIAAVKTVVAAHASALGGQHSRRPGPGHSAQTEKPRAAPEQHTHEEEADATVEASNRRLQQQPPPPPRSEKAVHIHIASVVPDTLPNFNGARHRILQGSSSCPALTARVEAVADACCNAEPTDDCSSGAPMVCNAGCAAVFLPFWDDCGAALGAQTTDQAALFQQTVGLCQATAGAGSNGKGSGGTCNPTTTPVQLCPDGTACPQCGSHMCTCLGGSSATGGDGTGKTGSVVHEFQLVCSDGSTNCVPRCDSHLRGDLLLLALNGEDSKYSCEVHRGQYSWVGAATDGGYLGSDAQAFVSAVLSGAAGYYALALSQDASIAVDLVILPGQDVRINGGGSASAWGVGSFTVQQGGSLSLVAVVLPGGVTVQEGGSVSISGGSLDHAGVAATGVLQLHNVMYNGQSLTLTTNHNLQCSQPYITLNDGWRSTDTGYSPGGVGGVIMSDHARCNSGFGVTRIRGERWYRFTGLGGDALPLTTAGFRHCGTTDTGWLSGWTQPGQAPPRSYTGAGKYPVAAQGVVEMTACFDQMIGALDNNPCGQHVQVGVVQCEGFLLWRLPESPSCHSAYCTTPSGLSASGP
eukprot:COSAG01_NODE_6052_length_3878_cov_97.784334_3_plen_643_part_00